MNKKQRVSGFLLATMLLVFSCSSDEQDIKPNIDNEAITTVQLELTNSSDASDKPVATWEQLLDANNKPLNPDVSKATLTLKKNAVYVAKLVILDKTQSPPEDATVEIRERSNAHLFFYQPLPTASSLVIPYSSSELYPEPIPTPVPTGAPLALTVAITDHDTGTPPLPLGLETSFTTGNAGSGWLRIVLRHQPDSKNGTYAPGSTDLDVGFTIVIE